MSARGWDLRLRGTLGALELDLQLRTEVSPTVIVGSNGAGKTTLLRTIAGAATGVRGRVALGDRVLLDTDAGLDVPAEHRRMGYVPQGYGLFPHLDALHNVTFGLGRQPDAEARARATLRELDAEHLASRRVTALSGGEQQRVALARALVIEPAALLLDEPLAALDVGQRRRVRRALAEHLRRAGCPAIVVTHDLRDVRALGGEVVVLEGGRVIQQGSLEQLQAAPASEFVAELLGADDQGSVTATSTSLLS